jgi:hypothetical protein
VTDPFGAPPKITGEDYSSVTYEQVLFAVTGNGVNLRGILDTGQVPGKGWFVVGGAGGPKPADAQTDGQ